MTTISREVVAGIDTHADTRPLRQALGISLETAAAHFGVWPMKISTIDRGKRRDDEFTTNYRQWLTAA